MKNIKIIKASQIEKKDHGKVLLDFLKEMKELKHGNSIRISTSIHFQSHLPEVLVFNKVLQSMRMEGNIMLIIEL